MKLNRKYASFLLDSVNHWRKVGLLNEPQAKSLLDDIQVISFDWRRLAKYSMWVSLICIVTAIGAVFADKALLELLERIFNAPDIVKCVGLSAAASGLYWWGVQRKSRFPQKIYSNEGLLFLGVLATAGAVYELGRAIDTGSGHFSILPLLSFLIYGVLGFLFHSNLIWIFSLASLGSWFGTETGYMSGWGAYYLGMNYPLRFILFGGVLVGATFVLERTSWFKYFFRPTLVMGLLYLFVALWIMSIFGNYGDMASWQEVKQIELFHWSLMFGLVAGAAILHGLRFDNELTKGFGITFLFINLYTRYFEYFWDALHKAVFFAVLGVTFWLVGARAEKIWNLGSNKTTLPEP
ncbi:MAG: DUF2157 domain-containing protein [Deltaproteobacteria bacterium]|nr:DUF2157 domain-containing protein [Deltaproteobacteria bacterium]